MLPTLTCINKQGQGQKLQTVRPGCPATPPEVGPTIPGIPGNPPRLSSGASSEAVRRELGAFGKPRLPAGLIQIQPMGACKQTELRPRMNNLLGRQEAYLIQWEAGRRGVSEATPLFGSQWEGRLRPPHLLL